MNFDYNDLVWIADIYYDKPWERTNNGEVASVISNGYKCGEGEYSWKKVNSHTNM
jgi:hypothetical protein